MVTLNGPGHLRAPRALPFRKKGCRYPLAMRMCGLTAALDAVKKSLLSLPGIELRFVSHLVCSLVAMSTELFYV
jgi:hypothetical protein